MVPKRSIGLLVLVMHFSTLIVFAQSREHKWAIGAGVSAVTYPDLSYEGTIGSYEPGAFLSVNRYLSGAFNFGSDVLFVPQATFPYLGDGSITTSLVDMNYHVTLKFNNGVTAKEDARFAPYLLGGIGGSYSKDRPDGYVPVGGGLNLRLGERTHVRLQTVKKLSLNNDYQHLAHSVGVVYNFGKSKKEGPVREFPPNDPPVEEELPIAAVEDRDNDGTPDPQDLCPDAAGTIMNNGCPEEKPPVQPQPTAPLVEDTRQVPPAVQNPDDDIYEMQVNLPCQTALQQESTAASINFAPGSDELPGSAYPILDGIARLMMSCPGAELHLEAYRTMGDVHNPDRSLAVSRAARVKYYLVSQKGINQNNIIQPRLSKDGETQKVEANVTVNDYPKETKL